MEPTNFKNSNLVIGPPKGVPEDKVKSIFAAAGDVDGVPVILTCWKASKEDLERIASTGRIWLLVYGSSMPPVALTTICDIEEKNG